MRAVVCDGTGGPEIMSWGETAPPRPAAGEVLVRVTATAVNRADLAQREGRYPVPPGASPILGLECSGIVAEVSAGVSTVGVGDPVMALVTGGAYAEFVAVPAEQIMPAPKSIPLADAGALPETLCTVYSNLIRDAGLRAGQKVLVHGGGSGIGTTAIQVIRAFGAVPLVTVGSPEKAARCIELGAELAINYRRQDFVAEVRQATGGRGVDVLLDCVGANYLQRNMDALANDGTALVIGLQGGSQAEIDLSCLMRRRLNLRGSTLRARPADQKRDIVAGTVQDLLPLVERGEIRPIIDQRHQIDRVADAHAYVGAGGNFGKVLLNVRSNSQP
ncbi:NAD(P)H-quinone oxidoreductase [Actinomadura latina]|uniref:NAD(P)H-quinone oxidoreductase n=1 Tax=Actinomadura latina TaxID=163603 RepID=A0A846Z5V4_9ACTN|nr:NAD(P)H-quinone oxidoreductase [Actinomadura latina]